MLDLLAIGLIGLVVVVGAGLYFILRHARSMDRLVACLSRAQLEQRWIQKRDPILRMKILQRLVDDRNPFLVEIFEEALRSDDILVRVKASEIGLRLSGSKHGYDPNRPSELAIRDCLESVKGVATHWRRHDP